MVLTSSPAMKRATSRCPLSIWCIVIDKHIIRMLSSFSEALQGLFVRLRNCPQWHRLPAKAHSAQDAPNIQVGVFRGDEYDFRSVACVLVAFQ